jgi:OOP family OmpA-OmpF porin
VRLNQIAASGVFAFLAMSVVAPASVLAQSASVKCNTVVDSTGKPVTSANNTAVLHAGSYDCPPPAAAAPAAAVPPAAPLANAVYFVFFDFDRSAITPAAQDILNTVVTDARRTNGDLSFPARLSRSAAEPKRKRA